MFLIYQSEVTFSYKCMITFVRERGIVRRKHYSNYFPTFFFNVNNWWFMWNCFYPSVLLSTFSPWSAKNNILAFGRAKSRTEWEEIFIYLLTLHACHHQKLKHIWRDEQHRGAFFLIISTVLLCLCTALFLRAFIRLGLWGALVLQVGHNARLLEGY